MATKRAALYLAIDPELRARCKALAAQDGKTLRQWVLEALNEKLEREPPASAPPVHIQFQRAKGSLKDALEMAKELLPIIESGTFGAMEDAAEAIKAAREERLKRIVGE